MPSRKKRFCLSRHHRKCKSHGGTNAKRNISIVRSDHHEAYHLLFGNRNPKEVASFLNKIWIDPDYYLVVKRRRNDQSKE